MKQSFTGSKLTADIFPKISLVTFLTCLLYNLAIFVNPAQARSAGKFNLQFFVSVIGTPSGDGTAANPWDLQTALNQPAAVLPGSTICLGPGRYVGNFTSNLTGTITDPIVVKSCDGSRVIIDGSLAGQAIKNVPVLLINGAYTWYMGFEVTNSDPEREITQSGSNPPERRGPGLSLFGPGIKIINLLIYDAGEGIDAWTPVVDGEFYGNVIFNNGWVAPDSHHGHGIYTQNNIGTKKFINNTVLNNFGYGWQVYGSANASLNNFYIEGNLIFNDRWLIGGFAPLHNIELNDNFTYRDTIQIGYANNVLNTGLTARRNYFASLMKIYYWADGTVKSNTLFSGNTFNYPVLLDFQGLPDLTNFRFDSNTYHWSTPSPAFQNEVAIAWENTTLPDGDANQFGQYSLSHWKQMGQDVNALVQYFPLQPPDHYQLAPNKIFIRRNIYDTKRANVIIYNWEQVSGVSVDVSGILNNGDSYELHNVLDYFGDVQTGTFTGGLLSVPMINHSIAHPLGYNSLLGENTFPEFGSFILINTNNLSSLPLTYTAFSVKTVDQDVLLQWDVAGEVNVDHYIIERSGDGIHFDSLGLRLRNPSASAIKHYEFKDPTPLNGKNFYRIDEKDPQGRRRYSEIRMIDINKDNFTFIPYPNPSRSQLHIILNSPRENRITYKIFDVMGRTLVQGTRVLTNGSFDINIAAIANGLYYLKISTGHESGTQTFIKN